MPKRINPHNAELQQLLHARSMTIAGIARQLDMGESHVHLCQVFNGRREGRKTMRRLKTVLADEEWKVLIAFRRTVLGPDVDKYLEDL